MREEGRVGWEYYPSTGPDNDFWDGKAEVSGLGARIVVAIEDAFVVR